MDTLLVIYIILIYIADVVDDLGVFELCMALSWASPDGRRVQMPDADEFEDRI